MPYFVYRIEQGKKLQYIDKFEKYREAREYVRQLRPQQSADEPGKVRMVFAENQMEAETLLLTPREAPVEGDD